MTKSDQLKVIWAMTFEVSGKICYVVLALGLVTAAAATFACSSLLTNRKREWNWRKLGSDERYVPPPPASGANGGSGSCS
jgi:hypothetical protein